MTLRDVGDWFSEKWQAILDGVRIAATESFWDWPLWLSISVGIGVPILILWFIGTLAKELREGEPEPLGWTIAFGVLTFLCVLTTYELWVSMVVWEEGDKNLGWLRIA